MLSDGFRTSSDFSFDWKFMGFNVMFRRFAGTSPKKTMRLPSHNLTFCMVKVVTLVGKSSKTTWTMVVFTM